MKYDGAIVDKNGIVIKLRPFPNQSGAIPLGNGTYLVKLTDEQTEIVREGWVTLDNGETYQPR